MYIVERELPPPLPPRTILHDATTSTEDLYVPPPPLPPKQGKLKQIDKQCNYFNNSVRPATRETGTTTAGLPKRPLCVTGNNEYFFFEKYLQDYYVVHIETQVIE